MEATNPMGGFSFRFTSEGFGCENGQPSEERFGKSFSFFGGQFQVLLDFRLHLLKFFGRHDVRESPEK